jgi:U3 small nucleolar RNA-associated protein 6
LTLESFAVRERPTSYQLRDLFLPDHYLRKVWTIEVMAGVAEKARFFLEQSVPQLRDFEAKGVFTTTEVRSLVRKRTDFEHLVLSAGSKPSDWLAYYKWERGLESLRAKRCKRLGIKASSAHVGQGRAFGILERAANKHPGSLEIWKEYLRYASDVKATKRWRKTMSRALRLHPAKSELWVMAGRRSAANADMQGARGFFMRGARFCTKDSVVWIEYARCEMEWLERMEARKAKKGGVAKAIQEQADYNDDQIRFDETDSDEDVDEDGRMILPNAGPKTKNVFNDTAVEKLEKNPALDGAIPMAIFDISKKQPFFSANVAAQFFDLFAAFPNVSSQMRLAQHVLDTMNQEFPNSPVTNDCDVRQALINVNVQSAAYPNALREALGRLRTVLDTTTDKIQLAQRTMAWIEPVLSLDDLDAGIRTVLEHSARTLPKS